MIDQEITVAHVFTKPYDSFDENTGKVTPMVNTTIEDVDGKYYATSSKTAYYDLLNIMKAFGSPTEENYKPLKVKITGTKREKGVQIGLTYIGRA